MLYMEIIQYEKVLEKKKLSLNQNKYVQNLKALGLLFYIQVFLFLVFLGWI